MVISTSSVKILRGSSSAMCGQQSESLVQRAAQVILPSSCEQQTAMQSGLHHQHSSRCLDPPRNTAIADTALLDDDRCSRIESALSTSLHSSNHTNSTLSDGSNSELVMDNLHPVFWKRQSPQPLVSKRTKHQMGLTDASDVCPISLYDSLAVDSAPLRPTAAESPPRRNVNSANNSTTYELNDSFHHKGVSYKESSSSTTELHSPHVSAPSSLEHLIQSLNQLPQHGDDDIYSEDDDDASFVSDDDDDDDDDLSDLSGLTEVFAEYTAVDKLLDRTKSDDLISHQTGSHARDVMPARPISLKAGECLEQPPGWPRRRVSSTDTSQIDVGQVNEQSRNAVSFRHQRARSAVCASSSSLESSSASDKSSHSTSSAVHLAQNAAQVSNANHPHSHRRAVSFDAVHVRHYERILSDNPASRKGPSIGIGWKYTEQEAVKVSQFEGLREKERCQRASELVLPRKEREKLIYQLGYTERDMAAMVRDINKCRHRRRQTVNNLSAPAAPKTEETVESARHKMMGVLTLQSIGAHHAPSPHAAEASAQQPRLPQRGWGEI